jgi:hypothetical protein
MIHLHEAITASHGSTRLLRAAVVVSGVLLLPLTAFAENAVTRWAEHAMQSVRAANVGTPNAGRLYAMVTVAMYDAVNGIDTAQAIGREHALVAATGAPRRGNRSAAAAAAAHAVLVALVPAQMQVLDAALDAELATVTGGDVSAGRQWGHYVGERVVSLRANDGTQAAGRRDYPGWLRDWRAPRELRRAVPQHDAIRDPQQDSAPVRAAAGNSERRVCRGVR